MLTNSGINNVENIFTDAGILKNKNFYDPENLTLVHHVNQALEQSLILKVKTHIVKMDL